ncbi:hypothetical protein LWI29_036006 [Acer saccharum]|uniref:Uncharacterized protein n=1 Tax=Acer saccharum TaxID=4024 RepID=A0AA39SYN8_ACESA|nr:hypothetical protein LWI29_036006 [Acer saccharum]
MDYGPPIALPLHQEDALQTSIKVLNLETHLSGKKSGGDPEIASSAKKAKQQKSETSTPHPRPNQNHHPNHHQIHPNHHQIHTQITTKPHPNHFSPHTSEERKREREKDEGCGSERRRRRRPVRRKEKKTKAAAAEGEEGEGRGSGRRRRRRPWQWKEMKAKAGAAVVRGEKERRWWEVVIAALKQGFELEERNSGRRQWMCKNYVDRVKLGGVLRGEMRNNFNRSKSLKMAVMACSDMKSRVQSHFTTRFPSKI